MPNKACSRELVTAKAKLCKLEGERKEQPRNKIDCSSPQNVCGIIIFTMIQSHL